ncbi:MAG: molybdopterin-dependent oxidoreductase [Candidatus Euphemobacter frigidus]|nr:molybdopterin-dependent oxidoreductase [Candidatus Euphemobacter frigidus]MDP8276395.1 molybdopterin-dependent oxidoreductase [Candidatus Euphemobacter frigidus]
MKKPKFNEINKGVRKVDGLGLAVGQSRFTDDYEMPGMLHAKLLRSPYAHARIKAIRTGKARALPGVVAVFTYKDVDRIPITTAGQGYPEPSPYDEFILDNKVRFVGDKVALVAAETVEIAEEALKLIEVDYEVLPAVLDPRKAMQANAPIIHDEKDCYIDIPVPYEPEKNRVARVDASVGDVKEGVKQAAMTVEDEFENQTASHSALEPHCALSWLDDNGRLVIISTTQVPFHARRIVSRALKIPVRRIRIIKPRLGGGFGGKQEILLEPYVGLITLRTGRPVKMRLTRREVFISARVRHNMITKVQVAAKKDGELTAIDLYALSNTGPYGTHGLTVASNVGTRTLPMFKCPNLHFSSDVVYTNLSVSGAYRGYGGTQGILATAIAMDDLAERLGMDPMDFYLKNVIRGGTEVPILKELGEGPVIGQPHIGSCELAACIKAGAEAIGWKKKRGRPGGGRFRRGMGMSIMMQGSSIPYIDMASAFIKINDDGSFNLLMGATEIGQGSDTVLAQIAAEVLTVATDKIIVYSSDTDLTPFDVGAYASSTTYLSGMAVKDAAEKVKRQILEVGAHLLQAPMARVHLSKGRVIGPDKKSVTLQQIGTHALYEEDQFQISASASRISHESPPPFAAHFVEVEVDRATGKVRILEYVQAVDCGTLINPVLARGQALGALINGISYALVERYIYSSRGECLNPNYGYYNIFCTRDIPKITTIFVPSYEPTGPFGAKSVGEICISGPLPAISNAIYDAVDVRLHRTPFTPDKVLEAVQARERG